MICLRGMDILETSKSIFIWRQKMRHRPAPWFQSLLGSLSTPRPCFCSKIRDRSDHRLCIQRDSILIGELLRELCHALFLPTLELQKSSSNLWWPKMKQDIETSVSTCVLFYENKPFNQRSDAPNQHLPGPQYSREIFSMDFITCMPKSSGCDSILEDCPRHFPPPWIS